MRLILFVCSANRFRSPIAAAYMERKLREDSLADTWMVVSAGTWTPPSLPAHPSAVAAAADLDLDLSGHRTREISGALMAAANLIIVMEPGQKEALECEFPTCRQRICLLGELAGEGDLEIPDPSKLEFIESDAIAKMISIYIDKSFDEILRRAEVSYNTRLSQRSNQAGFIIN